MQVGDYEKIYRFENLYKAFRESRKEKSGKAEVIIYELRLTENLWYLHYLLKTRTYRPSPYHTFWIHDPKLREIQALSFGDRVLQHSLCDNVLRPYFEPRLIYDSASCRIGKGSHFAMDRLSGFMRDFYKKHGTQGYVLKCDVKKYFDNINHDVLKYKLRKIPDPDVKNLLYLLIDSYHADTGKGIPMGNQSSQWFALYYLDRMDRVIKEKFRIKYYSRYMDDLVLIHESKDYLKEILAELTRIAHEELDIEFNQKTQIFPIASGVDYLGWHFYLTDTGKVIKRLRTSNKRRFKRRMKAFRKKYNAGTMTLEQIQKSLASYRGHLSHGHTYRLRQNAFAKFVLKPPPIDSKDTENDKAFDTDDELAVYGDIPIQQAERRKQK